MRHARRNGVLMAAAGVLFCVFLLAGCQKKVNAGKAVGTGNTETVSDFSEETADGKNVTQSSRELPIVAALPSMQSADETVYVTGDRVNVRKGADTGSAVVTVLARGASVRRTGIGESWSRIVWEGQEYYMASQYLSTQKPKTSETPDGTGNSSQAGTSAQTGGTASAPQTGGTGSVSSTGNGIGTKTSGGSKGILVAIDAGHQEKGNNEKEPDGPGSKTMKAKVASGTAGAATGLAEYKLNLAVSLLLKEELVKRGYDVYMVREIHDVNLSNAERAKMANDSGADIFVRVHANSLGDSSVRGTLTMCMTKKNPYNSSLYEKSRDLSKKVVDSMCAQTGFRNRGIQETDTMSGINWCEIPVTIVEMGFMSNTEEDRLMATEEYQVKFAKGIADGIDAYYGEQE